MMIQRTLMVAFGVSVSGLALGQSFELRAGAGTVANGSTFMVMPMSTFHIEVWSNLPTAIPSSNQLHVAVAYGDAQGIGISAIPSNTFLSYESWVWSSFSTQNYTISGTLPAPRSAATPVAGNNYVTTNPNLLPIVAYGSRASQTPVNVPAGQTLLATLQFSALAAPLFSTQRIYVAHNGGPNGGVGTSGINPGFGSPLYRVQVVPEPATLISFGAGAVAVSLRRRKKR